MTVTCAASIRHDATASGHDRRRMGRRASTSTTCPAPEVRWRLAFCHHPPFSAGPKHHNTDGMERLLPLFARGGARAIFSGHEHNVQHAHDGGIDYFVTGAGSKLNKGARDRRAG